MKIAYVDHSFHQKTKSTVFLADILRNAGHDVEFIWDDSWNGGKSVVFDEIVDKYDLFVFFQLIPKTTVPFRKTGANIVYIPMFDTYGGDNLLHFSSSIWRQMLGCKVLCFSKVLESAFLSNGVVAKYFQYYPNPDNYSTNFSFEDLKGFFWGRMPNQINWQMVRQLIAKSGIKKMHLHLAVDPHTIEDYISDEDIEKYNITTTKWFKSKEGYIDALETSQLYFAPRICEGIGMSFLEAMAMGKCVVAPNVGTMNDYIMDGLNGLLYGISYNDSWLTFQNRDQIIKDVKLFPSSLDIDKEKVLNISKNARQSVEVGYRNWKSKEGELLEFIFSDVRSIYQKYYGTDAADPSKDVLAAIRKRDELYEMDCCDDLSEVENLANKIIKHNKLTFGMYQTWRKMKLQRHAHLLLQSKQAYENDGEDVNYLSTERPNINENLTVGRVLQAGREDLIKEGGLRTKGLYRVSSENTPCVTIITVVYNGVEKLERAILSVLKQSYPNVEYIIIDGGSTDGSLQIIEKYVDQIDYFCSQKDGGIYEAMNKGISLSLGEFIGIVNSDDMILEDGIYDAVSEILQQKADYVAAQSYCVDGQGNFIGEFKVEHLDERCLVAKNPCNHGAMLISSAVYNKIGYYDTKYRLAADYKFQVELCLDKQFVGCKLFKNIHYFEMAGASIIQRQESLREVAEIIAEFIPTIDKKQLNSLVYFMHEKLWNDENYINLEEILNRDDLNALQKEYLLSEMQIYGYAKGIGIQHGANIVPHSRRITPKKLLKYILPYGIVDIYAKHKYSK